MCLNVQYSYAVVLETQKKFVVSEWQLEELVAHLAKHDPMVKSWTWTLLCPAWNFEYYNRWVSGLKTLAVTLKMLIWMETGASCWRATRSLKNQKVRGGWEGRGFGCTELHGCIFLPSSNHTAGMCSEKIGQWLFSSCCHAMDWNSKKRVISNHLRKEKVHLLHNPLKQFLSSLYSKNYKDRSFHPLMKFIFFCLSFYKSCFMLTFSRW